MTSIGEIMVCKPAALVLPLIVVPAEVTEAAVNPFTVIVCNGVAVLATSTVNQ